MRVDAVGRINQLDGVCGARTPQTPVPTCILPVCVCGKVCVQFLDPLPRAHTRRTTYAGWEMGLCVCGARTPVTWRLPSRIGLCVCGARTPVTWRLPSRFGLCVCGARTPVTWRLPSQTRTSRRPGSSTRRRTSSWRRASSATATTSPGNWVRVREGVCVCVCVCVCAGV